MNPASTPRPSDESPHLDSTRSVLDVLREIKAGLLDPKILSDDDRRQCVVHLTDERLSVAEIAQVMRVSVRTVWRDRRKIQEEQAIRPDPQFTGMFAGKLVHETEALRAHVHRILRDSGASREVRVEAARVSHEMLDKLTARLQSMGFLNTAPQRSQAEVTHFDGDAANLDELGREVERLRQLSREITAGQPPAQQATSSTASSPAQGGAA